MKQINLIFTLIAICQSLLLAQQNRPFDTTYSVVTLSPAQNYYLDSRIVAQINGRSRITLPVQLPPGTVKWYYTFAALESKNEPLEWVSLAAQLTKIVDKTGISATLVGQIVKPTGTAACDIYVLDTEGGTQFEAKNDDKWQFDKNISRQNMTSGVVESYLSKSNLLIGLSNPSLKSGINVKIEVSALVAHLTPIYNNMKHIRNNDTESAWTGVLREPFFKRFQESFEGKLTPSVSEVSMCILSKVTKNFTPQEFNNLAQGEQEVVISWIKKDCYAETKNEALEKRMMELEEMKLKINQLEQSGDFGSMASLAERTALEFPSIPIQTTHMRALLLSNQLGKAQTLAETLAKHNPNNWDIQLNLAHIYLLSNQYKEAEKAYLKFQKKTNTEGVTWEKKVAEDFDFFIKNKIFTSSYDNIKKKLKIK
ncbi:MAG: tetratricopeptide repeat protein [Saprospiraceae bacterium]|nr:tetratricopeptide repeat protein [Saprospiraceae bacterium]